jgi:hypothetical protein
VAGAGSAPGRVPRVLEKGCGVNEYEKNQRRMLWLGKFAFPKVNTKTTKIMIVSPCPQYNFPIIEPPTWFSIGESEPDTIPEVVTVRTETITVSKWGYKGKRHDALIRMGYSETRDVLIVARDSFIYGRVAF